MWGSDPSDYRSLSTYCAFWWLEDEETDYSSRSSADAELRGMALVTTYATWLPWLL